MEDLKIKNNTSFLECSLVMLPKEKRDYEGKHITLLNLAKKQLAYGESNNDFHNADFAVQQDLYITSDEKIESGDWYIYNRQYLRQNNENVDFETELLNVHNKKVISTTNRKLKMPIPESLDMYPMSYSQKSLPNISIDFINKYIYEYNKGIQIKNILVEYENNQSCSLYPEKCCGNPLDCTSDGENVNIQNVLVSSDNIISVKLLENLKFTLDDIKNAFYAGREQRILHENDSGTDYEFVNDFEDWIEEFKNKK